MNLEKYMIPCWTKKLFGVACLGCGFQRAFLLFIQGEFAASFRMYPAIYTTLVFLSCLGISMVYKGIFSQKTILVLAGINGACVFLGYLYRYY
ncbi:DUF2752 domain-containing protein [Flavobacterium crassostreae]|uniref:DUF2752 domain-containing protein n=1 Tax=Flavobacterium crassostreae TaxID=1763534 RepID=A0A1B9E0L3_9FLAO|nr:DUF2752 domain-containing protein [Flavobacterium crassostreae]OCB75492.1 hypothetical protein LPBF_07765 [Flavobacterium crassostreae]